MFEMREQVSLALYTTFAIGGNAKYFLTISKKSELGAALDFATVKKLPTLILGGGSNILVSDEGFNGVVMHITFSEMLVSTISNTIEADAGATFSNVIFTATEHRLAGVERLYGIPGTIGGAIRGNVGAFGVEIQDVVNEVVALNSITRDIKTFSNEECHFAYRNSFFKQNKEWIILSTKLQLQSDTQGRALSVAIATLALRNKRQIQNIQSAGSFFMNPSVSVDVQRDFYEEKGTSSRNGRVPAGWLIEKVGFKNKCVHHACTGKLSTNYIINKKRAKAIDVRALVQNIQKAVHDRYGVVLQSEVMQVGFE